MCLFGDSVHEKSHGIRRNSAGIFANTARNTEQTEVKKTDGIPWTPQLCTLRTKGAWEYDWLFISPALSPQSTKVSVPSSELVQGEWLHQYVGAGIIPVVPAFWSILLSCGSGFPGHSFFPFPVVPAFRVFPSFLRFGFPVNLPFFLFQLFSSHSVHYRKKIRRRSPPNSSPSTFPVQRHTKRDGQLTSFLIVH